MIARARAWSDEELRRLAEIVAAGRSPFLAAAALKRTITCCQNKAREIGTPFKPIWAARKDLRDKCAAAERKMAGH